jgi:uncharacterized protein YabE (DUF348 family)
MKQVIRKFKKKFSRKYIAGRQRRFLLLRHHPFAVPVVTFIVLFLVTSIAYISFGSKSLRSADTHVVIVSHDKKQQTAPTRAATVGELLKKLNITIGTGDIVEPSADTPIVEDNFRVNVYRARPVTIIDGGHKILAYNAASTPRSIASQAGVTVYPEDNIAAQPSEDMINTGIGENVVINRAVPANINLYGTQVVVRSHAKTVGDLLKEKNVILAKDDTITPAAATILTPNVQVVGTRHGTQLVTAEEVTPSDTQTVDDPTLSFGTTAVRQAGSDGKKLVTYQITLQNGKEVGRAKIQEVIAVAPVTKIIARGRAISIPDDKTSIMAAAGISSSDYSYVNYIISRESGWCATKWQGEIGYCPAYYQELHSTSAQIGYGLCQSTPPNKMASAGGDWQTNAVTQLRWCAGYAAGRYGGWEAAYNHWANYGNW